MPDRRDVLRNGVAVSIAFLVAGCTRSAKSAARLIPDNESFGGRIDAGSVAKVRAAIAHERRPYYVASARAYVSPFPAPLARDARSSYPSEVAPLLEAGLVVLYQRCTHLGCRVPWCESSQWFECPCHDAKFDRVGEYRQGPAPRGLDLMVATIEEDRLVIDTGKILPGVAPGTNTTHQAAQGPFCVGSALPPSYASTTMPSEPGP